MYTTLIVNLIKLPFKLVIFNKFAQYVKDATCPFQKNNRKKEYQHNLKKNISKVTNLDVLNFNNHLKSTFKN